MARKLKACEFKEWVEQEDAVTIGDLFADLKDIVPEEEK